MDGDVDATCKYCEYPGDGSISCPECEAEIDMVAVEHWSDGRTTIHCPACQEPIDRVLEE